MEIQENKIKDVKTETAMEFIKRVQKKNPKLMPYTSKIRDELDYRVEKPLFANKGKVFCTKCANEIDEKADCIACPYCGQLYRDRVGNQIS